MTYKDLLEKYYNPYFTVGVVYPENGTELIRVNGIVHSLDLSSNAEHNCVTIPREDGSHLTVAIPILEHILSSRLSKNIRDDSLMYSMVLNLLDDFAHKNKFDKDDIKGIEDLLNRILHSFCEIKPADLQINDQPLLDISTYQITAFSRSVGAKEEEFKQNTSKEDILDMVMNEWDPQLDVAITKENGLPKYEYIFKPFTWDPHFPMAFEWGDTPVSSVLFCNTLHDHLLKATTTALSYISKLDYLMDKQFNSTAEHPADVLHADLSELNHAFLSAMNDVIVFNYGSPRKYVQFIFEMIVHQKRKEENKDGTEST